MRCLHFCDNDQIDPKRDRMSKLGSFMSDMIANFQSSINVGEFIGVDEELLAVKNRLGIIQFNPKKRARFGIKIFVLCDCETKFVLNFIPYQGKTTPFDSNLIQELGSGGAAVVALAQKYFGKNRRIVIDNWFTSLPIAKFCKERKTDIFGTIRRNRKHLPVFNKNLEGGKAEAFAHGEILVEQ
jgi:Transposase IS4